MFEVEAETNNGFFVTKAKQKQGVPWRERTGQYLSWHFTRYNVYLFMYEGQELLRKFPTLGHLRMAHKQRGPPNVRGGHHQ